MQHKRQVDDQLKSPLFALATQSDRLRLSKQESIFARETAQLPEAILRSHIGYSRRVRVGRVQGLPRQTHAPQQQVFLSVRPGGSRVFRVT